MYLKGVLNFPIPKSYICVVSDDFHNIYYLAITKTKITSKIQRKMQKIILKKYKRRISLSKSNFSTFFRQSNKRNFVQASCLQNLKEKLFFFKVISRKENKFR